MPHGNRQGPSLGRSKEKQNLDNVFSSLFSTLERGTWPAWFCHYKLSCRDVLQQTSLLQADNTLTQPALATASRPGWHKQLCCSTECVGLSRSRIDPALQLLAGFPSLPPGPFLLLAFPYALSLELNLKDCARRWVSCAFQVICNAPRHCCNIAATGHCRNVAAMR